MKTQPNKTPNAMKAMKSMKSMKSTKPKWNTIRYHPCCWQSMYVQGQKIYFRTTTPRKHTKRCNLIS